MTVRDPPHRDTAPTNVVRLVVSALLAAAIFWLLATSQAVLVTGASNVAMKLGLPVVALTLVALKGDAGGRRFAEGALPLVPLAVAAVVGVLFLRSEPAARSLGGAARPVAIGLRRSRRPCGTRPDPVPATPAA